MDIVLERGLPGSTFDAAVAGDPVAFARIVAAFHDDMARVAFVVCRDVDLAQEAVQAAWATAWPRLGTLRDRDRLRPWLITIAANEARQLVRRRLRRGIREIALDIEDGGTITGRPDPADGAALVDLANALAGLDPGDRAIVGMRYAAGMTSAEIGAALGISDASARVRMAKVLRRLRKDLGDD
jgi:RNA polymerase sigma-70 factor (ECF subfamily)